MNCRHCQKQKVNRPRGLCWSCYYRPGVRDLYAPTGKQGNHCLKKHRDFCGGYELPEPTTTAPGTPERMEVLAERARLKQSLWHPDDGVGSEPDLS
jgi:hypothetical protein